MNVMEKFKPLCDEAQYYIEIHEEKGVNRLIVGVRFESIKAHTCVIIDDNFLQTATCASIAKELRRMTAMLADAAIKGYLVSPPKKDNNSQQ